MSYVDLIPNVRVLSQADKLRLIQWISGDLASAEDLASNPTEEAEVEIEVSDNGVVDRVANPVDEVDLRNAVVFSATETSHSYSYWSPDRNAEASAILARLLKSEKSTP
jgi:hypothetical protein